MPYDLDLEVAHTTSVLGVWERTGKLGQPVWLGSLVHYVPLCLESKEGVLGWATCKLPRSNPNAYPYLSENPHLLQPLHCIDKENDTQSYEMTVLGGQVESVK